MLSLCSFCFKKKILYFTLLDLGNVHFIPERWLVKRTFSSHQIREKKNQYSHAFKRGIYTNLGLSFICIIST